MPEFAEEEPFEALLDNLEASGTGVLRPAYVGADPRFKVHALDWNTPKPAA